MQLEAILEQLSSPAQAEHMSDFAKKAAEAQAKAKAA